jgi:hypothetical protein
MVVIIGGEPRRFRPLIDLYREAGRRADHSPERLTLGLHSGDALVVHRSQASRVSSLEYEVHEKILPRSAPHLNAVSSQVI